MTNIAVTRSSPHARQNWSVTTTRLNRPYASPAVTWALSRNRTSDRKPDTRHGAPVHVVRPCDPHRPVVALFDHSHQAAGIRIGQVAQQHGVDEAEHRGIRADAQRHDQDGRHGEPGTPSQHPDRVVNVLDQFVHDPDVPHVAALLLALLDACFRRWLMAHP